MKQKLLSLLVLLTMCVGGWAHVTPEAGKKFTMRCAATSGHETAQYISIVNGVINGNTANTTGGTPFRFESTGTDGQWRIIDDATDQYLEVDGTTPNLVAEPTMYWTLDTTPGDGIRFLRNGAAGSYLNNNPSLGIRGGTGGCSSWVLTEYVYVEKFAITYIYKYQGEEVNRTTVQAAADSELPNLTLPYGVNATKPAGTVTQDAEYEIVCTFDADNYPFKYSTSFETATWYMLTIRGNKYPIYDETQNEINNGSEKPTNDNGYFAFIGTPWGTKIYNKAMGADNAIGGSNNDALNGVAVDDAIDFVFENNSNHFVFALKSNPTAHINDVNSKFGVWTNGASATDPGSTLTFEKVDFSIDAEFKAAKAAALATIASAPVLFGNAETAGTAANTAKAAIEAIQYDATSPESVAEAVAQVQSIMSTMYASVQNKKVVFFNDNRNNKYMVVVDAVQLAGADAADGRSEFIVNGNAEGQFTIQNTATGRYIANTPAASNRIQLATEAGKFTIKSFGTTDKFAFISVNPTDSRHNSLHLDNGHNVVAWEADQNGNASVWIVKESELTDEQLAAGVTAVKEQAYATIGSVEGIEIGTGLNKYTATAEAQAALEAKKSTDKSKSFEEILDMKNVIANGLDINKPADGSFIRIRSVKNGNGYVNAEASSAHSGCLAVGQIGNNSIYCYTDGKLVAYTNGMKLVKNSDNSGFLALGEAGAEGANIAFAGATRKNGAYTVTFDGRYLYAADNASNTDAGSSEGNDGYNFTLEQVTELPVTLSTVGEHSYATFYATEGITDLDGVQAFVVNVEDDKAKMTKVTEIPAQTAVVLYSAAGSTAANLKVGEVTEQNIANMLAGTVATQTAEEGALTLQNNSESGIGFYAYTGTNLKGFRAYIPAEQASNVKGLALDFDMETIVRGIEEAQQQKAEMFDLSGRRIQKAQKGIYIVNGKKVIK